MTKFEKQIIEALDRIETQLDTALDHSNTNVAMLEADEKDIFIDPRDGNKYYLKTLPDGKEWLMENLRFKVEDAVWNEEYNCYMYTWDQARKAIPEGFHLPTAKEFHDLCFALGYLEKSDEEVAKRLLSECGFVRSGGSDNSGGLYSQGSNGYYWSSTQDSTAGACNLYFYSSNVDPGTTNGSKNYGLAVRCIKD